VLGQGSKNKAGGSLIGQGSAPRPAGNRWSPAAPGRPIASQRPLVGRRLAVGGPRAVARRPWQRTSELSGQPNFLKFFCSLFLNFF
jgi:hypothetical protein